MHAKDYMQRAIELSKTGIGKTYPNPSVGCVIVKDNKIIGEGRTSDTGRPHAEFNAMEMAKNNGHSILGAEVFVTLEPCAHQSLRGPSCADILSIAKPKIVFISMLDPDLRTFGQGVSRLNANGIETSIGLLEQEAREVIKDFIDRLSS